MCARSSLSPQNPRLRASPYVSARPRSLGHAAARGHYPLGRQQAATPPSPLGCGSRVVWLLIHSRAPAPRCCRCGGWAGRGTLCLRLPAAWACPAPLTDTRCTHVRAGLLLLLAVVHPTTGSLLPSPPLLAPPARRPPRTPTNNRVGGWENFNWLGACGRERCAYGRHVGEPPAATARDPPVLLFPAPR